MFQKLAFHRIPNVAWDLALQHVIDPLGFSDTAQAFHVLTQIRAPAVLFPRKIERDLTLGASYHTQKRKLWHMLVASHALPHGDLFDLLFHHANPFLA